MSTPHTQQSIFAKWARLTSDILNKESELVREFIKHPTRIGDAREALVKGVLARVLPPLYEIGTGQIIDAEGGESKQIDVVISRKDFPALRLPDGSAQYLVEGVLAAIEVKSTLDCKTLTDSLDKCYSVGCLSPHVEFQTMERMVQRWSIILKTPLRIQDRQIQQLRNGVWGPPISPIMQALHLSIRPETYVFGFGGYSEDEMAFRDCVATWLEGRQASMSKIGLPHLPTLATSAACVLIRNQYGVLPDTRPGEWPLLFTRVDPNPLGLFITRLLIQISRAVSVAPNAQGVRPTLDNYFAHDASEEGMPLAWAPI